MCELSLFLILYILKLDFISILKNRPLDAIRLLGPCAQFFQDNVCPPYNKIYMSQDLLKTALDLVVHYSVPRT